MQISEKLPEALKVGGVKRHRRPRAELTAGALKLFRVSGSEDEIGSLQTRASGGLESDTGGSTDHDDDLPSERGFGLL